VTGYRIRLAFFDVDGTLKAERDPYMYLHRQLGTEAAGLATLNAYLAGEIDYETFAQRDAALWAGIEVGQVDALFAAVPYVPQARLLAERLRVAGAPIVLISSGVDRHVRQVATDLGAAEWICNELLTEDGRLTGRMRVRVDWYSKGRVAREFMARFGVGREECLAVGDGRGDLPMFAEAAQCIAVNPYDEQVRAAADLILGEFDLAVWLAESVNW
jgi:phosphoserine phosphatase